MQYDKVGTPRPNRYKESEILDELTQYIASTYNQHYATDEANIQVLDLFDADENASFCKINAVKYLKRFGKKEGHNRKDLIKAAHYIIMLIHFADKIKARESKAAQNEEVRAKAYPIGVIGGVAAGQPIAISPFATPAVLGGGLAGGSLPSAL